MTIRSIYFSNPEALFLLLAVFPLLLMQWILAYYRKKQVAAFLNPSLFPQLLVPRSSLFMHWKMAFSALLWLALCIALMNPSGNFRYAFASPAQGPKPHDFSRRLLPHEVVFLVDTSASMGVLDGGEGASRLEAAKEIIDETISFLKGELVSLYSFTSILTPLVPPTYDHLFARLIVKSLSINHGDVGGTDFAKILESLNKKLFPEPKQKNYSLILLSDGGDAQLEKLQGAQAEQVLQKILSLLPDPQKYHFRLYTIGIGEEKAAIVPDVKNEGQSVYSKLEPSLLKSLADKFDGTFYQANEWRSYDLAETIANQLNESVTEPVESLQRKTIAPVKEDFLYDLYYQIPLGFGLLCLLAFLLLPEGRSV